MKYLVNSSTDPFFNMAFDQWCLESLPLDEPVFYLWRNRPAVIIGLNQNAFAEVNRPFLESRGIELVRRVTGGGAVYHDLQNLNYTIVGRSVDMERDYPAYASMMARALRRLGVPAELSGRNDITVGGRKVSGYAKRVWRDRLMVHGTLMYNVDIETLTLALDVPGSKLHGKGVASVHSRVANLREYLPGVKSVEDLQERLTDILAAMPGETATDGEGSRRSIPAPGRHPVTGASHVHPITLTPEQTGAVEDLARTRFRRWEWNWGRSPAGEITRQAHLPCGTLACGVSLREGLVHDISFSGDFIGTLPPDAVVTVLQGCRYNHDDILGRLKAIPVAMYFDGTSPEALAALICP